MLFRSSFRKLTIPDGWKYRKAGTKSAEALNALVKAMQQGVKMLLVQDTPHLVVLHKDLYHKKLIRHFAMWGLMFFVPWLRQSVEIFRPPARRDCPAQYAAWEELDRLGRKTSTDDVEKQLLDFVSGTSSTLDLPLRKDSLTAKLVCLCRDWVTLLLPYAISKRNRVHYGLLPDDRWAGRAKVIGRKLCAVPYVGKDTPSDEGRLNKIGRAHV